MQMFRILGKRGRVTIPLEIRQAVGFKTNDVISFTADDNNTITLKREKVCDNCKGTQSAKDDEFLNFLDKLSEEQQREALIHLSVKWAERKGEQQCPK